MTTINISSARVNAAARHALIDLQGKYIKVNDECTEAKKEYYKNILSGSNFAYYVMMACWDRLKALVVKKQRVEMLIKASEVADSSSQSLSLSLEDMGLVKEYL